MLRRGIHQSTVLDSQPGALEQTEPSFAVGGYLHQRQRFFGPQPQERLLRSEHIVYEPIHMQGLWRIQLAHLDKQVFDNPLVAHRFCHVV